MGLLDFTVKGDRTERLAIRAPAGARSARCSDNAALDRQVEGPHERLADSALLPLQTNERLAEFEQLP